MQTEMTREKRRAKGEGRKMSKAGGYPTPVALSRSLPDVTTWTEDFPF